MQKKLIGQQCGISSARRDNIVRSGSHNERYDHISTWADALRSLVFCAALRHSIKNRHEGSSLNIVLILHVMCT